MRTDSPGGPGSDLTTGQLCARAGQQVIRGADPRPAKRVVHLTSVHRPEDPRIFLKEARSLAAAGYDVTIVSAETPPTSDPGGVSFLGVTADGSNAYIRDPTGGLGARLRRLATTTIRVWRIAANLRADLYHFHDPELLPMALLLKLFTAGRVVYDAHEDVPKQILDKRYLPVPVRRPLAIVIGAFERLTASAIDAVVTATPPIARRFPARKTTVVQNFPLLGELSSPEPIGYASRPQMVCYVGGLTLERGFREILAAARLLRQRPEPTIVVAGRLKPASLESEVRPEQNVTFLGWRSREGVAALLSQARAGIVTFHPTPNYFEAYPIKLFEYMSAGLPVIASDFPIWREIVGGARAGLLVDPRDPQAIAEAVEWLFAHETEAERMGERGRALIEDGYNWRRESARLLELYRRLLNG